MQSNNDIIKAIKEGNNKLVIKEFYHDVLPKITNYVLSNSGSADDINEIMQQLIEVIYRKIKLENFEPNGDIRSYAFVVGKNLWINRAKHLKRVKHMDDIAGLDRISSFSPNYETQNERNNTAHKIVEKLGDPCSTFLKLRIFKEMKLEDIVQKMGYRNKDVAKSVGSKCKKRLLELIRENKQFTNLLINEL